MEALPMVVLCLSLAATSSSKTGLPPALDITRLESLDPACHEDLQALREGLHAEQLWAQMMWDAGAKAPVGLLSQTAVQFGDFDECLSVSGPVEPQYCLVDVSPQTPNSLWEMFRWGVCAPASCSPRDLSASLQQYMDQAEAAVVVSAGPESCNSRNTTSGRVTLSTVVYCLAVGAIIVVVSAATILDFRTSPEYDGLTPPNNVLQCLSARRGWASLQRVDQPVPGVNMRALYGFHSAAFFFIVLGHRFAVHLFFMSLTNYKDVKHMFADSWFSIWAGHMDLFVDMFFFMSGFLLAVMYYAELHKRNVSPAKVILNRLCRLVPVYVVVVFFYVCVLRLLGDGPLWNLLMAGEQENCNHYWWTNLLFINNYVYTENMCMPQTWYVSCEFQLFVVGTLLVVFVRRNNLLGRLTLVVLFVASTIAAFWGTYHYNRPAFMFFYKEFWTDPRHHDMFSSLYSQSHYRGTTYLPGLMAGIYVYKNRDKPLSKKWTYIIQAVGLSWSFMVYWSGSFFQDLSAPQSTMVSALYAATFHSLFGLAQALIVVSFTLGTDTTLSKVFSWNGFVPFSKLSYSVFLIHLVPQLLWVGTSRTPVYLNPLELVSWTTADVVLSLIGALLLCLTVETPARYLFKYYTSGPPSPVIPTAHDTVDRFIIQS